MKKLTQRVSPVQIDFVFTRGCCSVLKEIERQKEKKKKTLYVRMSWKLAIIQGIILKKLVSC